MATKRAVYPVEFKALNDSTGQVEALVSIFGNVDLIGDRVIPGAFAKSISAWKASGDPIPVVFSHEWGDIWSHIGVVDSITETSKGLLARYTLDIDTNPVAAQVYKLLKRRSLKEHSFAYEVETERRARDGANELVELGIIEIGPCLKGVNPDTELLRVKALLEESEQVTTGSMYGRKVWLDAEAPGSFEEMRETISDAVSALLNPTADPNVYVCVQATYPTYVLVEVDAEGEDDATYQIPWTSDGDDAVKLGTPALVEVTVTVTPKSATFKAGARLSYATKTEMQSIHDGMGELQTRMAALMGVAEEKSLESERAPVATGSNEMEAHGKSETEGPAAKPHDSVSALLTRIAEMRATTGIPA